MLLNITSPQIAKQLRVGVFSDILRRSTGYGWRLRAHAGFSTLANFCDASKPLARGYRTSMHVSASSMGSGQQKISNDVAPHASPSNITLRPTNKDTSLAKGKLRLDAFISLQLPSVSRAKAQAAIKEGMVLLNGSVAVKPGVQLRSGDLVVVTELPEPPPLEAIPEAIPLDIVYEDDHLIVINKPAGMVVHISAGHHTGTLVNALLHHCGLPGLSLAQIQSGAVQRPELNAADKDRDLDLHQQLLTTPSGDADRPIAAGSENELHESSRWESEEEDEDEASTAVLSLPPLLPGSGLHPGGVLRPGIVHRLDKGTSGLLVVAKRLPAHQRLCDQFKARTVGREYLALVMGTPMRKVGRIETNIDRDPNDRKRMAALAFGGARGRQAASNYVVEEVLAGGGAALMRWKLESGRTHQIRVHAKHLGHPLLGDDTYGGSAVAAAMVVARGRPSKQQEIRSLVNSLGRPALHARTLAFTHPETGQLLSFAVDPPVDFQKALEGLRDKSGREL